MSTIEEKQAQQEALAGTPLPMSSRRANLWAGMMRYMAAEAMHEHAEAEKERREGEQSDPGKVQQEARQHNA